MESVKLPDSSLPELIEFCRGNSKVQQYKEILKQENEIANLVSRETFPDGFFRLAAESLLPMQFLEEKGHPRCQRYLDIGSGGGFPSIPIILTQEVENSVLVDRVGKKASALTRMIEHLNPETKVEIINRNFDEIKFTQDFDLITVRLVKLTPNLLKKLLSLLNSDGTIVYYSIPEFRIQNNVHLATYSYTVNSNNINKSFSIIIKK